MSQRLILRAAGLLLSVSLAANSQNYVTGTIGPSQVVGTAASPTLNISLFPVGQTNNTLAAGDDNRWLNATKLNGTSITTLTGLLKLTSGTPSNAAAADVVALFSSCNAGTPIPNFNTLSCVSAGGTGTVTSVALSAPTTLFTLAGSPITGSGTLALSYATGQTANQVFGTSGAGAVGLLTLTSAHLPNPTTSAIGGVKAYNSVTNQFLTSIGTDGTPAGAQPSFANLSGTAAATQLPLPTSSTIGGVKSYTAVTNQFVTSVDTSGNHVSAQPSFTNLSGSATTAQLPTSIQVWSKYTIPYTAVQTPSTTNAVTVVTLSARQLICGVVEKHTTAFAGSSITAASVTIGDSNGTGTTYAATPFNALQAVSNTAFQATNVVGLASFAGGTVQANFTSTGANLSALTAGSLDVMVCSTTLP